MNKIILIPLDERPCNLYFPTIMPKADYQLVVPEKNFLGNKKTPADTSKLTNWLVENCKDASIAILSLDTLIYGGLIPSRLHFKTKDELIKRLNVLKTLKEKYPKLKIYAFQTIMRCPFLSSNDEEPDYYLHYGNAIHRYGKYTHKQKLGLLTDDEVKEFEEVKSLIPTEFLNDYLERRDKNLNVLFRSIDFVKEGVIDSFIISQDDSAPYGFTAMDQRKVREYLKENKLQIKIPVYPSADDTGMTLLARAVNYLKGVKPKVYVYYASTNGPFVTPAFEDRTIDATVKNQIFASGCQRVYSLPECDIMMAVNIASEMPYGVEYEKMSTAYEVERSLIEYIQQIKYALSLGKVVAVADVAYPSWSDCELVELLNEENLLLKIHAYAGWNTSSNTIGTVMCQSCLYFSGRDAIGNRNFLLHRYYDDVGYCSHSRTWIDVNVVPQLGLTVFKLDGEKGVCVSEAKKELMRYMSEKYPQLSKYVEDIDVSCPWNRTFEMNFNLKIKDI